MRRANVYAFVGVLLVGCGQGDIPPKSGSPAAATSLASAVAPAAVTVSGQVFVVTRGRDNIKLALVNVAAFPEQEMEGHIKVIHNVGIEQQKQLTPQLEAAARETKALARTAKLAREAYLVSPQGDGLYEKIDKADRAGYAKASMYQKLKRDFEYYDSPGYYLSGLTSPANVGKTDADGKFTLTVPSGKYIIAATTSRSTLKGAEHYYWLVKLDASTPTQSLMLSNDNLLETKCGVCVLLPTN